MKTHKKLISVLLAVLIAISGMSAGFYAIAADGETPKTDVQLAEEAIRDFSDNHVSNLYLNDTDGKGDDAAEAEKKAAARKALDELAAKVKTLTDAERLQMDKRSYSFILMVVQDDLARNLNGGKSPQNKHKVEIIRDKRADVEAILGTIPASYAEVIDMFMKHFSTKYGMYFLSHSSIDYSKAAGADVALRDLIADFKKLSLDQIAFSDSLNPESTGGTYLYQYRVTTDNDNKTFKWFIKSVFNCEQDMNAGGSTPSLPSYFNYVSRVKDSNTGEYVYSWKAGKNAEVYINDINNAVAKFESDAVAVSFNTIDEVLSIADVFDKFDGTSKAVKEILAAAKKIDNGATLATAEARALLDLYENIKDKTFWDLIVSSNYIFDYTLEKVYTNPDELTPEILYSNGTKLNKVNLNGMKKLVEDVFSQATLDEFEAYVKSVDLNTVDEKVQQEAIAMYNLMTGEYKYKVAEDVYEKYCTIVFPISDANTHADEIASFKPTEIIRPENSKVAWTVGGIQTSVDGFWKEMAPLVKLALGVDIANGLDPVLEANVYQPAIIEAIFDLYAQLTHDETNLGEAAMNLSLGTVIQFVLEQKAFAGMLEEEKFAYLAETIANLSLTDEEKANNVTIMDKLASITFTAEQLGFTAGDKASFIDTLLAVIRPITTLLAPDGALVIGGMIKVPINVMMFDVMDKDAGEFKLGVYSNLIPLLEQLGVTNIPTNAEYEKNYWDVRNSKSSSIAADEFLRPIINAAFEQLIGPVSADPLNGLIKVLPRLAYVIDSDMINTCVKAALSRAGILSGLAGSLDLSKDAINAMIPKEIDLTDSLGVKLELPPIDWAKLANCCTLESLPSKSIVDDYFVLRTGETDTCFTTLFYYIYDVVFEDEATYKTLREFLVANLGFAASVVTDLTDPMVEAGKVDGYGIFLDRFGTPTETPIEKPKPEEPTTKPPTTDDEDKPTNPTKPTTKPSKPTTKPSKPTTTKPSKDDADDKKPVDKNDNKNDKDDDKILPPTTAGNVKNPSIPNTGGESAMAAGIVCAAAGVAVLGVLAARKRKSDAE